MNSYMGRTLNEFTYRNSQSGGLVTEVLSYLFEENLIVCALVVKSDFSTDSRPSYFLAKNIEDVLQAQKSKYTPVDILSALGAINEIEGEVEQVTTVAGVRGSEAESEILKFLWYRKRAIRENG